MAVPDKPVGIVIRTGRPVAKPAIIWAYMWADDGDRPEHWHRTVPKERAA